MSDKDVHYMELLEVSKLIQSRKLSSVEVTQAQLDRIAKLDTKLKSYVTVMADKALKEANTADEQIAKGRIKGPLHGVPVAVKDLCWTDGEATTFGMPIFKNNVTREDG
ncbi:MAG: Asp-tRNA(Asn)/Glu-tRNA(Gln) amidotransferase GatCAB subunit A, partial [Burkholderiaceae bacterium]|nr:Asp-tRNA(Asn)/Glu-tRNA(Gln) amidotransferase GatCAB subunit A [Burkholderiaceae bacterium]